LATCFDSGGSSSGPHYEAINVRTLRTSLGSQKCLQKIKVYGLCPMDTNLLHLSFINIIGIPNMYAVF